MKHTAVLLVIVGSMIAAGGCAAIRKPQGPAPKYSLEELVSKVKQNTQGLGQFRSDRGNMMAKIPTDKGRKRFDLDGVVLLYEQPKNLYLTGNYLGQTTLQIGSNPENYWVAIMHDPSQFRWGYWRFADQECNKWKKTSPLILLDAIGPVNLAQTSGKMGRPVLRTTEEANILSYESTEGRFSAKEVYLSRYDPIVVTKIVYYNADRTEHATIVFSKHEEVAPGTYMAKRVELNWPTENSYMRINFGRVNLQAQINAAAFTMPSSSDYSEVEQVDIDCK